MSNLEQSSPSEQEQEFQMAMALLQETVIENPFIPHTPTAQQALFLTAPVRECFFGGAAGGGKSAALLMAALQYVTRPGYAALMLRKSFADLRLPGALIDMSHQWLSGTAATWNGADNAWTFPGGSSLTFGYLGNASDMYRYQSSAFAFIGFDELSQFEEQAYRFMFSRNRRNANSTVPLRVRSASNPGGIGHQWIKKRFIDDFGADRLFVPARLTDNPHLDAAAYLESLAQLDPVTRAQLQHGDWDIQPEGNLFKRAWLDVVDVPPPIVRAVRGWDLAATEAAPGKDPDYTAGCKIGAGDDGNFYILDIQRFRETPSVVERNVKHTAMVDGEACEIRMEQEPGSSGKALADHYAREVLAAFNFHAVPSTGDKVTWRCRSRQRVNANRSGLCAGSGTMHFWMNSVLSRRWRTTTRWTPPAVATR
jgi:predicted phage terminase large subunit-like protein